MIKKDKIENCYFTSQPDLWKGIHLLAMKYKNMNVFQRLLFRIKARLFKPKLIYKDNLLLSDCTFLREKLDREDLSYNDYIKKEFENAKF